MVVGYETTSTALSYSVYVLATHPHIQLKLREEIDHFFIDSKSKPNTENVKDLSYLDMFIREVLRYYPIAKV
jgi:cytochrome P450